MFDLFDATPHWPRGWSDAALLEEKEAKQLGFRRRVVEYRHDSGAKLATSEKWQLSTDEFMHISFRVKVADARPAGWIPIWSYQTPGASKDHDWLIPGRSAPFHRWRNHSGQWRAIGELMDHLGLRVDA
jgi:hypothetical protein